MEVSEYLGLDVGGKRIGVARGNSAARLAEPLTTLDAKSVLAELKRLAAQHKAAAVVVGLPRSLDGAETKQTESVREWVDAAKKSLNLKFYWQDEALSSRAAIEKFGAKPAEVDAVAAAVILQDFLDGAETDRVEA